MTIFVLILVVVIAVPLVRERMRKPIDAETRAQAEGSFVQLSQGITHYDWIGPVRGPVAVCVHGLTTPSFVWRGLARGLAQMGYRVLIYDLYGRGFSDRVDGIQEAAFFNLQLEDLLASQDVADDITLIGYSMGGAIATCFAAEHLGRIRQLVLIAPAGMGVKAGAIVDFIVKTPRIGDWLMLAIYPHRFRQGVMAERDLPSSVPDIADRQLAELTKRGFVPAVLSSLRGILSRPQEQEHRAIHRAGIPVIAVWGRDDDVIPLTAMGALSQWSRNARQEVIDEAGHGLTYTHTNDVLAALKPGLSAGPLQ